MVEKDNVEWLLDQFDLGASTAENDPLLEAAKIETQEFNDLYLHDRIDKIKGIKGAGKTALYRLFFFLSNHMIEKKKTYCIFGVEATGDPVFRLFQKEFENYNEIEFENFWGVYFIALVYKMIFDTENLKNRIQQDDITKIDNILSKMGVTIYKSKSTPKDIAYSIFSCIKRIKIKAGMEIKVDSATPNITIFKPTLELEPTKTQEISIKPIYLSDFKDALVVILEKYDFKIWIMLDRLDEIFIHLSSMEKNGLKGLLRAAYNFSNPSLRVKIFLREDIIEYLASDGFTALTHIMDRCSSTLSWSKDNILYLIVKRISAISNSFNFYYNIDSKKVDIDKKYREEIFCKIFPPKIGGTPTIDWLFTNCADGNDIVTPRDMIDFFKFAKSEQFKKFKLDPQSQEFLIMPEVFTIALEELSKHKKITFLFAEFPHLKEHIMKFDGGYTKHNVESLKKLLGNDYVKIVDKLKSIGFIKYVPKNAAYKIPPIWRSGLNMKRAKAF